MRSLLRELNANLPVTEAMPLSEITAIGLIPQRVTAAVADSLGIVGLLLAAVGIYGVTSYAVARRTRGVQPTDPVTFTVACVLFAVVTLTATYVPARRATPLDPMVALRHG